MMLKTYNDLSRKSSLVKGKRQPKVSLKQYAKTKRK